MHVHDSVLYGPASVYGRKPVFAFLGMYNINADYSGQKEVSAGIVDPIISNLALFKTRE